MSNLRNTAMSGDRSDPLGHFGPYTVRSVFRAASEGGCGEGETADGGTVFLRWSRSDVGAADASVALGAQMEYRALTAMHERGVPRALDMVRTDQHVCVVTEFLDGRPLSVQPTAEIDIESVVGQLVRIASHAHAAGWVHGDIKPENVLLTASGEIRIIDWELARPIGAASCPGTLGYAPPSAWESGYSAQPHNDVYALAVLARELRLGRRLFSGERAAVLAKQASTVLFDASASPLVSALMCAADRGVPIDLGLTPRASGVDAQHLAVASCVDRASSLVARLPAASADSGEVPITIAVPLVEHRNAILTAIADRWRIARGANAFRLGAMWLGAASVAGRNSPALRSQLEARRAASGGAVHKIVRMLKGAGPGLIVASTGEVEALGRGAWKELGHLLAAAGEQWVRVTVSANVCPPRSRRGRWSLTRELCHAEFGVSHVPDVVVAAIASTEFTSCEAFVVVANTLRRDGLISVCGGSVVENAGHGEMMAAAASVTTGLACPPPADTVVASLRGHAGTAPPSSDALTALIERGESAVLVGDTAATRSACTAAAEMARTASWAPPPASVLRLADLHAELGDTGAARELLDGYEPASDPQRLVRVGHLLAAASRFHELRKVVAQLRSRRREPHIEPHVARFRALGSRRRFVGRGYRVLRAALRRRAAFDDSDVSLLLSTLGNELRVSGRVASAVRVLRVARGLAEGSGAIRARLKIDTNLLIATQHERSDGENASEWRALSRVASAWGMAADAFALSVRAAHRWLAAGDADEALAELDHAEGPARESVTSAPAWRRNALRIRAGAADRLEAWNSRWRLTPPDGVEFDHFELRELADGLKVECGHAMRPAMASSANVHERAFYRAKRVALRYVSHRTYTPLRTRAVVRAIAQSLYSGSPLLGPLARDVCRGLPDTRRLPDLLAFMRGTDAAEVGDAVLEFVAASHVVAIAIHGVRDRDACMWLVEYVSPMLDKRAHGCRRWEWALAFAVSEIVLRRADPSDVTAHCILSAMEDVLHGLWPDVRGAYAAQFPLGAVGETAGVDVTRRPRRVDRGVSRLTAFRAELHRAVSTFRGARGRAAGLERVLASARRLRSSTSLTETLGEIVSATLDVCRAERAVIVFGEGDAKHAKIAEAAEVRDVDGADAEVSQSALSAAEEAGRTIVFDDATQASALGGAASVRRYRPRSLLIAPLKARGEIVGYLYAENRSLPKSFSESDVQLLDGFAAQAAIALENARLIEQLESRVDELRRVRAKAVRAENLRVLGQMAGEVAHDFNNLLSVILGHAELLLQNGQAPGVERSLGVIQRAAEDGAETIRRIQNATRGRGQAKVELLDASTLLREVLDFARVRWATNHKSAAPDVRMNLCPPGRAMVRGVPSELREVFTNLVMNAIDAMDGGGRLDVRVEVRNDAVLVSVGDTGPGIPERLRASIFDPFFSTKGDEGNGLGLSIAADLVKHHGGTLDVDSVVGVGTTMLVSLPWAIDEVTVPVRALPTASAQEAPGTIGRALVVDDDPEIIDIVAEISEQCGFVVESAVDGAEALARLRDGQRFDVVVTDLYMPEVSGYDVIECAREHDAADRIVLMTGVITSALETPPNGVDRLLSKPFSIEDVRRALMG